MADELFAKDLRNFETCVSNNNNLCRKLVSPLELLIKFEKLFEATPVSVFTADFSLLSCQLDNFTFKVLYWVNFY